MKRFVKAALLVAGSGAVFAAPAHADSFVNGGFEGGTFSSWEQGGGSWGGGAYPQPADYFPPKGPTTNSITNAGFDPRTDNKLRTVYSGNHSAQVNDQVNNYSVSAIRQQVDNYSDNLVAFAYAAVLQQSHGISDSDAFIIELKDLTTNTVLFTRNVNSAATPADFTYSTSGWYYTDWTTVSVDVSKLQGHSFLLSLLANDCPYGGHAGYAYLDGFGGVVPPPVIPGGVPEPASWAMMIAGFGMTGAAMRRKTKKVALA